MSRFTWGGGLKGKIAESMAHGLPVVTTSVGIEGFGLSHAENVLVGDTPATFAEAVIRLHASNALYQSIRSNAWNYVNDHYSEKSAEDKVLRFFDRLADTSVKTMPLTEALPMRAVVFRQEAKVFMERHVLWRFRQR
jgi:glycosyltransferase involved in cell wall biosynthesis